MAQASATIDILAPPDRVWQLIGGFGSLPDWLPFIPKSELSEGGRVRHLANPGGDTIVERLEAFDNAVRSYTYSILQSPFPVTGYRSTLRVLQTNGGTDSRVEWSGEFTPDGVSDREAARLFQGIYEDGLKALAARFRAQHNVVRVRSSTSAHKTLIEAVSDAAYHALQKATVGVRLGQVSCGFIAMFSSLY